MFVVPVAVTVGKDDIDRDVDPIKTGGGSQGGNVYVYFDLGFDLGFERRRDGPAGRRRHVRQDLLGDLVIIVIVLKPQIGHNIGFHTTNQPPISTGAKQSMVHGACGIGRR